MRFLVRTFLRGLLFVVPVVATIWILVTFFLWVDGLIAVPEGQKSWRLPYVGIEVRHGVGFLLTVLMILGVGLLTSNVLTRWILRRVERLFRRVPVVKLVYTAIKDLVGALVSERKRFDQPVMLRLDDRADVEVIGFVTRDSLEAFDRPDKVAVYVPQSYNFAANLILVPRERVAPIAVPASDVMAFVVSGGVSGGPDEDEDAGRKA